MAGRKLSLGLSSLIGVNKASYPGGPATDQDILDWIDNQYRLGVRNALGLSEPNSRWAYPALYGIWTSYGNSGAYPGAGSRAPSGKLFPTDTLMDGLVDRGIQPMFMAGPTGDNVAFSLQRILDGEFNTLIDGWAQDYLTWAARISGHSAQCNAQSKAVLYRFAWEFDMDPATSGFPWKMGVGDAGEAKNTPLIYRKAFTYVSDRIRKHNGATGVKMVWCAWGGNQPSADRWRPYYPGTDDRADAVQFTGFDTFTEAVGTSMSDLYAKPLAALRALDPNKTAIVCETAVAANSGTQAQRADWLEDGIADLRANHPIIRGLLYYDIVGGYGFYDPPNGQNQTTTLVGWANAVSRNRERIWE